MFQFQNYKRFHTFIHNISIKNTLCFSYKQIFTFTIKFTNRSQEPIIYTKIKFQSNLFQASAKQAPLHVFKLVPNASQQDPIPQTIQHTHDPTNPTFNFFQSSIQVHINLNLIRGTKGKEMLNRKVSNLQIATL